MPLLHIFLVRHAQREKGEDHITIEGERKAGALGEELRSQHLQSTFLGYCSEKQRAKETLQAILKGAGAFPSSHFEEQAPQSDLQNQNSSEFDKHWAYLEEEVHKDAGIDWYLQFGDQRPDPETISPLEVAARVSRLVWQFIDEPGTTSHSSDDRCVLMVTHSGITELFLASMLEFPKVEAIGGILDYLEVAHLNFEFSDGILLGGHLLLRGKEYSIDIDKLLILAGR